MLGYRPPSEHAVPQRVLDRVWDNIDIRVPGCWPWKLSIGNHGYGQVGWQTGLGCNAGTTAHRVVWMSLFGPIPEGMTIDHSCRFRPCCNPLHLRLRSNIDNASDNGFATKTHCKHGHEFTPENTIFRRDRFGRRCRACRDTANTARSKKDGR